MKKITAKFAPILLLSAALLAFTSCSSTSQSQPDAIAGMPEGVRGGVVLDTLTTTATVQSINATDRTLVLQYPDGSTSTFACGPEVRNFAQIKVGDQVNATVVESVAIGLIKGGGESIGTGTSSAIVRAPLGAKPGGKIVDTVGFVAKVMKVDVPNRQVTLQMADGPNRTVKVSPDINLANVQPGDDVGVRLTRAFAIAVKTPEK